jgi:hypothetical protein
MTCVGGSPCGGTGGGATLIGGGGIALPSRFDGGSQDIEAAPLHLLTQAGRCRPKVAVASGERQGTEPKKWQDFRMTARSSGLRQEISFGPTFRAQLMS